MNDTHDETESIPTVESLSLEEKVGQLFHVGFDAQTASDRIESLVEEYHVGGVIYFTRNVSSPEQTRALSESLQETSETPLFISIDQEGGLVNRLPFFPAVPSPMAVGATGDTEYARSVAEMTATQLRAVGVNLNLAPILDINTNPDNPVIGTRSFGETPETVAAFGTTYLETLQSAGILSCGKHFPGHGDAATDSHMDMPRIDAAGERLREVELVPFVEAIDAGIGAIMSAHVVFPAVAESDDRPATLSKSVLTGLLREDLGFDGIVLTDDMEMNAIAEDVGVERGAIETIKAGADGVYVCHSFDHQRRAIDAVIDAVESGELPESRIDESVERVLAAKRSRDLKPTATSLDFDTQRETCRAIGRAAITELAGGDRLPFSTDAPVELFAARPKRGSPAEDDRTYIESLVAELERHGFDVSVTKFGTGGEGSDVPEPSDEGSRQVLCTTFNAADDPSQVETVEGLLDAGDDVVAALVNNPYDYRVLPDLDTVLMTYDSTKPMLHALAGVVAGEVEPRGTPPASLQ
jgi:beta-N-acetylhexosaminidase